MRLRRGRGGHGRPSIDSRRLEFIRHKPGEAIVSSAMEPMEPRGLCRGPGWKVGRASLHLPVPRAAGPGGPAGRGFEETMAGFFFPAKENAPLQMAGAGVLRRL